MNSGVGKNRPSFTELFLLAHEILAGLRLTAGFLYELKSNVLLLALSYSMTSALWREK